MKKISILILGASGLVGRDLTQFFSKKYKVYALSRNKVFLNKIKSKNISVIHHNIKNVLNCTNKIDYIINCIVTHPFSKNNNLQDYIDSNILSSKNIINFSNKKNVKFLINLSSMAVYGKSEEKIIYEDSSSKNIDLLAVTKLFFEKTLDLQSSSFVNLRLPGVLCNTPNNIRPWLNQIIYKIKNNLDVTIYNGNSKFNNIIDTFEIYKLIDFFILNNIETRTTFNFAASHPVKLMQIIKIIKLYFDSTSRIKNIKSKNSSFYISNLKMKNHINYTPNSTLNILKKYLKLIN